ncbi:MAG TPA: acetate kinase [Candidatus Sumerlaeota bacterium]|nr:acetate kinase [Candidatus Sumerlaeota bacterium]
MKVLVLNCGSSSLKFQLIETSPERIENQTEEVLAEGLVEKIGMAESTVRYSSHKGDAVKEKPVILEHAAAVETILYHLTHGKHGVISKPEDIDAVGHRIVHGGEKFSASVKITPDVMEKIRECVALAPLHNPPNILGYEVAHQYLPNTPHVAVFDTAFHQTMPPHAYFYALPYSLYERFQIRRYGFHGSSHRYLAFRIHQLTGKPMEETNIITVHLGNGSSMAAIKGGKSIDTSMGMTPLEGLVMGTRAGDIDPAIILFLMERENLELNQANNLLNKHSGLQGFSGISNDMRELVAQADAGNERAKLTIELLCYRVRKYIGAYAAALGHVDHIVFSAGIGENSSIVRRKSCEGLEFMGVKFDSERNEALNHKEGLISTDDSAVKVWVVPTNEEIVIARDTMRCVVEG